MCRKYQAGQGEIVFESLSMSPAWCAGACCVIFGVATLSSLYKVSGGSPVAIIVPIIVIVIGVIIIGSTGGQWVVFNETADTVDAIDGYLFNFFFRRNSPGKLSELTSILITVRITTRRREHSKSTSVSYDTTLSFSDGTKKLVANHSSQSRANDFVMKMKEWLDSNRPNHGIQCGSADLFTGGDVIIPIANPNQLAERELRPLIMQYQTVANPNQLAEQELRSLIVQYQVSSDLNAQAKGQKLNLAMEYNSSSLVGNYVALKQQNPVFTIQSETILLNNAQTIIDAKNDN